MPANQIQTIAAVNSGSSSLKFGLFSSAEPMQMLLKGSINRIGTGDSRFEIERENLSEKENIPGEVDSVEKAAELVVQWLQQKTTTYQLTGIGHRVVHGGLRFRDPVSIDDNFISDLEQLVALAPLHLPAAIAIIRIFKNGLPDIKQIACFDTAFHAQMPFEARHYAIPRHFWEEGIVRYGFHGLSCEYILQQLQVSDNRLSGKRIIVAHLGAGSSITAISDGHSIENTMGFTPSGGLVMNSRAGDIDPGIISYLLKEKKMNAGEVEDLFNKQSGLKALSESEDSMQQLLEKENTDPKAAQAILMYCYHVKKQVAALAAALGGLDILVFTGGIGENSAVIRHRICEGLTILGIELDKNLNERSAEVVSELSARVQVYVMPANEELMIARHVKQYQHK